MNEIQIFDNIFTEEIRAEVFTRLLKPHWGISGGSHEKPEIFWHAEGFENDEYFNSFLYEKITEKIDRTFSKIGRIYANGQTSGQCGTPHFDDGDMTFLYYPCPHWDTRMEGHLLFFESDELSKVVEYKPNRAVLFPGNIKHYANAPSKFFNGLRVSLAYKLWN
tara:strand:+ start:1141 stop:1632 length:492 start_codon:yes stop_codon:yes gene_type:complete